MRQEELKELIGLLKKSEKTETQLSIDEADRAIHLLYAAELDVLLKKRAGHNSPLGEDEEHKARRLIGYIPTSDRLCVLCKKDKAMVAFNICRKDAHYLLSSGR